MDDSLLQLRINELNSAILNHVDNKVHILGFYNADRLKSHLEESKDNWSSRGIYGKSEISFSTIKSDALLIFQENGIEKTRHQFTVVYKKSVKFLNEKGRIVITIRQSKFTSGWQIITEKNLLEFKTKTELESFLQSNFKGEIEFRVINYYHRSD